MPSDLSAYRPVLKEALEAFRTDPSYAMDMAKQAGLIRSRRAPAKELELDAEVPAAV